MAYSDKARQRGKERHRKGRDLVLSWLKGRSCDCGESDISKLSFHHLDESQKLFNIATGTMRSHKNILAEMEKCIVKCKNCHTRIHNGTCEERDHFLISSYLKYPDTKKYEFRKKLAIWQYKKNLFCSKCYIDDPIVLLFHHIGNIKKRYKVSRIHRYSVKTINKEFAKTICLCNNCHEDFHYRYGKITTEENLTDYLGRKPIPLSVNIQEYLSIVDLKISQFYYPLF